ncbi:DUF916 and DUF3324 domain-containing protein [Latilactobacillus sakei]|uniref:DUF916 and DUF3324 domain-containing protein n=1 Tax=Latilactobacillus sakei TaxID=1599 RepID=A0AAF0K4B1_LATSK|nr:DUF916 and DUF3324 domain-containing protein [Latilactobacillus sakei]WGI19337.1 DUF916 and DUF3324 domain-containing protein [Latilactobacillus sakei]
MLAFWGLMLQATPQLVTAATTDAKQKVTFMIYPEIPKDNLGGNKLGYFNLKLKPNTEKTLKIKVFNPTDKPITVNVSAKDAQTADDGRIDYLSDAPVAKKLLPSPGSYYLQFKPRVVVPSKSQEWVNVKVKMPATDFKGKKALAINLAAMGKNGGSINNRYVYAVGVTLNGTKLSVKKLQRLAMPKMKTGFVDKQPALQFKVNNPDPIFLKKGHLSIKLTNQKLGFFNYKLDLKKMHIAPNSTFNANLLLGGKRLVAGRYTMVAHFKSDQYRRQIKKTVQITKTDARYINDHNVAYQKKLKMLIIIISAYAVLGIILIYYIRKHGSRDSKND